MAINRVACTGLWLCLLWLVGCRDGQGATEAVPVGQWFHARLQFDELGDLPFYLQLPANRQSGPAYVINGEEVVEFQAQWKADEVTITGQWNYVSVITARPIASGELRGTWLRTTPLWGSVVRAFVAKPVDAPDASLRFPPGPPPKVSSAGIWRFRFAEHGEGKGVLEQNSAGVVRGYIKPGELGDIRFLAGNMRGLRLSLSQFNGNAANLVLAEISPDGMSMSGLVSLQNVWNEPFTATKGEDFDLVAKVHLKAGKRRVTLLGLDKYRGKPTLAIIFATWCSSCNDASPYLTDLYARYHPKGLEVLGVAYDLNPDPKENLAELEIFRRKYGVPWELLQVPCSPETWAANMPPELDGWDGLPIFLLVNSDGTVANIFGGWFGPATGADGAKRRKQFEASIDALIARKPTR